MIHPECKNCIFARPKCKNEIFALLPRLNLTALKPRLGKRSAVYQENSVFKTVTDRFRLIKGFKTA
ncbi:MAG: hypothetical protein BWK80_14510 [Desulfobacteraceae bacterium IS3]|nr:MAG: hypothetical protein BWK80_14510 [Desulfobacteraceae bacterium IS3]